ncbi:hemerythrin domain-containing protein [Endozoicomonas sp. 8E]|uniref:hemerythrin domain-containing protein n=1 Tax=Endozoicomonas sp. 8E TaxID=3035692 RepID=UPI002939352B|nr:hemerythrin domain-containing protein [Endozoicomonas sp. 8E]WOG29941.1 hemerythrin domain-containing protein [Endozoicomonas sp. 8E]
MSQLIEEFKSEHVQISDLLLQARDVGIGNQKGRDLILSAKKILLAHLNKEDKLLYPVLREAAENDESLKSTLTDYALDMDKISAKVMIFFNLYENGNNTIENFQQDCNNIIRALSKRISKEEAVLYKTYDKIKDL